MEKELMTFEYFFYYMIQLYHYALSPAFPAHA